MKQFSSILILIGIAIAFNSLIAQTTPNTVLTTESFLDFEDCESIITIYPSISDFTTGKEGVILISTSLDDEYHTEYQEQDGVVKIRAILPETFAGSIVYFRIVDPDLDDESPYEENIEGGDNRDMREVDGVIAPFLGTLSQTAAEATMSGEYAIAETELTITNRYAGDNYQLEASLDENFSTVVKTIEFIAWKRVYVETFKMYKKGGTLGQTYSELESDNFDDILYLDNISDFIDLPEGTSLELFTQTQNNQLPIAVSFKSANTNNNSITINDPNGQFTFPLGSGVRIADEEEVFTAPSSLLINGFGSTPKGEDGGVFIEFKQVYYTDGVFPKFTQFTNPNTMVLILISWRPVQFNPNEGGDSEDYIQLVGVNDVSISGLKATTVASLNLTVVFNKAFTDDENINNIPYAMAETVVHEFGHQFGLYEGLFPVIHSVSEEYLNHEGTDIGVMARRRNFDDGVAEFHKDCIYYIRDVIDGI